LVFVDLEKEYDAARGKQYGISTKGYK